MKTHTTSTSPECFELHASRRLFRFEIGIHVLVAICILALPNSAYKLGLLALLGLTAWRYFREHSVIRRFSFKPRIELDLQKSSLCWQDEEFSHEFRIEPENLRITRWFILLQLAQGGSRINCLLLADSFASARLYSKFRKLVQKINHAG